MSDDPPIVSHVASPEYRANIDAMTCPVPGCNRWRVDEATRFCADHRRWHDEGSAISNRAPGEFLNQEGKP